MAEAGEGVGAGPHRHHGASRSGVWFLASSEPGWSERSAEQPRGVLAAGWDLLIRETGGEAARVLARLWRPPRRGVGREGGRTRGADTSRSLQLDVGQTRGETYALAQANGKVRSRPWNPGPRRRRAGLPGGESWDQWKERAMGKQPQGF